MGVGDHQEIFESNSASVGVCSKAGIPVADPMRKNRLMEDMRTSMDLAKVKFQRISPYLDEKTRRMQAVMEASRLRRAGIETVSEAMWIDRSNIGRWLREPTCGSESTSVDRVRR